MARRKKTLWAHDAEPQLVVFTGAGCSAESGVPVFRGVDGLWEKHHVNDVCMIHTWKDNFELVHSFYDERRAALSRVEPNEAHRTLASWQKSWPTHLLTVNIDDLHERSGASVVHLHGSLKEMLCTACGHQWTCDYQAFLPNGRCPKDRCRSVRGVKPNVVFFGERAPNYQIMQKVFESLRQQDVLVVVGTSGTVVPIGTWAKNLICLKILVNLKEEPCMPEEHFDLVVYGPATQGLLVVEPMVKERMNR